MKLAGDEAQPGSVMKLRSNRKRTATKSLAGKLVAATPNSDEAPA